YIHFLPELHLLNHRHHQAFVLVSHFYQISLLGLQPLLLALTFTSSFIYPSHEKRHGDSGYSNIITSFDKRIQSAKLNILLRIIDYNMITNIKQSHNSLLLSFTPLSVSSSFLSI